MHAAIMNDDWDLALDLICPEDFGLNWLPTTSQRTAQKGGTDSDTSSWSVKLLCQKEDTRKRRRYRYH